MWTVDSWGKAGERRKLRGIYSFPGDERAEWSSRGRLWLTAGGERGSCYWGSWGCLNSSDLEKRWEDCKRCLHRAGEDLDGMAGRKLKKVSCWMSQKWEEPSQLRTSSPVSPSAFSKIWVSRPGPRALSSHQSCLSPGLAWFCLDLLYPRILLTQAWRGVEGRHVAFLPPMKLTQNMWSLQVCL